MVEIYYLPSKPGKRFELRQDRRLVDACETESDAQEMHRKLTETATTRRATPLPS